MASQPRPILSTMSLLLCSALLAFILQGAQGEVDVEGPSESQCRPFIEKALKEKLETGDTLKESTQPLHIEDIVTTEVINDNSEDKQGESIEIVTEEISQSSEIVQTSESGETEQETDETTQTEPKESVEEAVEEVIESVKESAEETIPEVVEEVVEGAVEEASVETTEETVTSSEHVQESIEVADEAAESAEQTVAETTEETSIEETKEETSAETTEAPSDGSEEQASQEEQTEQSSTEKEESAEVKTEEEHVEETSAEKEESAEKESGTEEPVNVESENASVEQEHETSKEAESAEQQHSAEDTKSEEEIKESSVEQEQTETESESTEKSHTESGEEVEQASAEVVESVTESTETVEEVTEKETEDSNQVSAEQADAPHASTEQIEAEQASAEQVESEQASVEQVESEQASVEQVEVDHASAEEASAEQAEIEHVSAEQVEAEQASVEQASAEQTEAEHASVEEASVEQTEAEHTSAEQTDAEQASVEQTETEHVSAEQADAPAESTESVEEPKEPAEEKSAEVEVTESAEQEAVEETAAEETVPVSEAAEAAEEKSEEDSATAETESEPTVEQEKPEPVPVEELTSEFEIPENLRSREHINQYLHLNEEDSEKDKAVNKVADVVLKELKRLYETAIKPLEILYKYRDLSNRHFGDPEIFSKPLVLFMGPWSGGKSSLINYLLDNEYTPNSLRTGAEPSPAYFNILMWGSEPEVLDGTQLAADWTFSGLQKFGQGLEERLRGLKLPNKLLEKVNIVEIPGILEVRKQVSRVFPFNDACQWFIDRADIIFLVYDPSKLDVGPETEAILDQLKGREYQTRIILNKADQVKPEELMRVQGALIWNISPLMSSAQPPVMYTTSLWSRPYEVGAPVRLLHTQEVAFLKDLQTAIEKRIENKISSARRFAVRVRNHAKMVDCYLTTYYNHKSVFGNKKLVADQIIEHPQDYHIYEGLSTLTNISRYDLPDPDVYRDFFRLNALYDFQQLSATCTYFRGCPINRLDISIAYDLPELVSKYKKALDTALANLAGITDKS